MKEMCLIDADIIGYRVGFTTQDTTREIAEIRTDELIRRIVHETDSLNYKCFLSGQDNFRYQVYPEYKGNRVGKPKPIWLEAIREHIVRYHNGTVVNGWEADDQLGIELVARGDEAVLASIDKDLLQVPGWHWNFVKGLSTFVSPFDGLRAFYGQVIAGDGADNIPSYDGKVRNAVPAFIQRLIDPMQDMTDELGMYNYCLEIYGNDVTTLFRNAKLLYIMKKEHDYYQTPVDPSEEESIHHCGTSECNQALPA